MEFLLAPIMIMFYLAYILIKILFALSTYTLMTQLPEDKRLFPAWFCWMFLIPFISYIFSWLMLPFGIPRSIRASFPDNPEAQQKANSLFGIGLAIVIAPLIVWVPFINIFITLTLFVLFIVYWCAISNFKKTFLNQTN